MKCEICGKEIEKSNYYRMILCNNDSCYHKFYWMEKVKNKDKVAIINNNCYTIGDEEHTGCDRGFDGAKFTIRFNDGRIVQTTNLWDNGKVPEEFRDLLQNNAVFIKNFNEEVSNEPNR